MLIACLSLIQSDQYAIILFALSCTTLIIFEYGSVCFAINLVAVADTLFVDVADDEVCLGELQALRLGKERAEAFDQKRTYW